MGATTIKSRICRLCNVEIGIKPFGSHLKSKHQIDFLSYTKQFKADFPKLRECIICKELCFSSGKDATCSRACMTKLRETWIGTKSHRFGVECKQSTKDIISTAALQRIKDGIPHGRLGKTFSQESRDKISSTRIERGCSVGIKNGMFGKTHTPEAIEKIFSHRKMNKLERLVADVLDSHNIQYHFQFFINKEGICKSYDFKLKDTNIILEIDGDFWHGNKTSKVKFEKYKTVQLNDILKTKLAEDNGYQVIRYWESDIKKNPLIVLTDIYIKGPISIL